MRPRSDLRIVAVADRFHVIDPYGIRSPRVLSELELAIFHALGAGRPFAAIRKLARARGFELTRDELAEFADELAGAGLFDGPVAEAEREQALRRSIVDGTLIVPGAAEAGALCEALLADARAANARDFGPDACRARLEGMLSPHGDLATTGAIAARSYALLSAERWPDVFVVIGTSHYGGRPSIALRDIHTPLGTIRCHRDFAERLRAACRLEPDRPEFVAEHSWRQDLPLLQTAARELGREPRVVPILIGGLDHAGARRLGRAIRELGFGRLEQPCVIASGDLTHYGAGYGWRPSWLARRLAVDEVVGAIRDHERPLLDAIGARDHAAFARGVAATSFCARSQVAALIEHATGDGRLLAHGSVVNGAPYATADARAWAASDALFAAASLVFARGLPEPGRRAALRACSNVVVRAERGHHAVIHRCTLASHAIPDAAWPLLGELWRGVASSAQAATACELVENDVIAFVGELERAGLMHEPDLPSPHAPPSTLSRAPRGLARRPFARADELRGAPPAIPVGDAVTVRTSSASSGRSPLLTVVENSVLDERSLAEVVVQPRVTHARVAQLNRPANLSLAPGPAGWPALSEQGDVLRIAPGDNPSHVAPDVWQRVIERLVRFDPEQLEGDPAYLAALAHECLARRVVLPRLSAVFAGHGYAWTVYRAAIRAAFGVEALARYHSSELGHIAIACDLGALHLLDRHAVYEVIARGRQAELGELGELVATTLDTRIRPLVRYATGDVVRVVSPACACGKPFRVIEFAGRVGDLLPGPRGRPITYPELDAAIGAPPGVRAFQLTLRERAGELALAPASAGGVCDGAAIARRVADLVRHRVTARFVDALHVAPGGKLLALRAPDRTHHWHGRFLG